MNHILSVITPCYNCETTLEEAVASVFEQNLKIPFEIVLVDDGSTDSTRKIILELAKKHQEIKYFFHKNNKGGGAARNTGVKNSYGNLIFCLDSDDILPEKTLPKMIDFMIQKECDGVLLHESRFFKGINKEKTNSIFNEINEKPFELGDLFDGRKGALTTVNFLYTKKAFEIATGYPEYHDFDTQSFGFRFLSKGLQAFTCPETFYYHRQANKKSYFERVYESGEFSLNSYYILEEILYVFSKEARMDIINYDVFKNSKLGEVNLKGMLDLKYSKNIKDLFIYNCKKYLNEAGFKNYINEKKDAGETDEKFIRAIYHYKNQEYKKAIDLFSELLEENVSSKLVYFNILRCATAMSGVEKNIIEKKTLRNIESFKLKKQKIDLNPNVIKKIIIWFWKLFKNIL